MKPRSIARRLAALTVGMLMTGAASAAEVHVMLSAGFSEPNRNWRRPSSGRAATGS